MLYQNHIPHDMDQLILINSYYLNNKILTLNIIIIIITQFAFENLSINYFKIGINMNRIHKVAICTMNMPRIIDMPICTMN